MSSALDWDRVETVLCDMDGTVLDLGFDNYFWMEAVPREWGARRGMALKEARAELMPVFESHKGSLNWYCLDFWAAELGLDIRALKQDLAEHISFLPGVESTLQMLRERGLHMVLLTNAHPHALDVKSRQTGLLDHFDRAHSTHEFGLPKERPEFWPKFAKHTGLSLETSVLVDDTESILQGAVDGGVGQVLAVRRPSTKQPAREAGSKFVEIHSLAELILP